MINYIKNLFKYTPDHPVQELFELIILTGDVRQSGGGHDLIFSYKNNICFVYWYNQNHCKLSQSAGDHFDWMTAKEHDWLAKNISKWYIDNVRSQRQIDREKEGGYIVQKLKEVKGG